VIYICRIFVAVFTYLAMVKGLYGFIYPLYIYSLFGVFLLLLALLFLMGIDDERSNKLKENIKNRSKFSYFVDLFYLSVFCYYDNLFLILSISLSLILYLVLVILSSEPKEEKK